MSFQAYQADVASGKTNLLARSITDEGLAACNAGDWALYLADQTGTLVYQTDNATTAEGKLRQELYLAQEHYR